MWKTAHLLAVVALTVIPARHATAAESPKFEVCDSTYALCTSARCTPISGEMNTVFCKCDVKTGLSIGKTSCHSKVESPEGTQIISRYYPLKTYAVCTNERRWASCFDMPCIIDKKDPSKTTCSCQLVSGEGPWLMITDSYNASICTTGLYSSASVEESKRTTDFLKTSKLKPFEVKVLSEAR
ncbi:MAG: hypothetical protein ACM3MH_00320 [Actinomycetota bacterium]